MTCIKYKYLALIFILVAISDIALSQEKGAKPVIGFLKIFESVNTLTYSSHIKKHLKGRDPSSADWTEIDVVCKFKGDKYYASLICKNHLGDIRMEWESAYNGKQIQFRTNNRYLSDKGYILRLYGNTLPFPEEKLRLMNSFFEPYRFLRHIPTKGAGMPVRGLADLKFLRAGVLIKRDIDAIIIEGAGKNKFKRIRLSLDRNDPYRTQAPVRYDLMLSEDSETILGWDLHTKRKEAFGKYRIVKWGYFDFKDRNGQQRLLPYPAEASYEKEHEQHLHSIKEIEVNGDVPDSVFKLSTDGVWLISDYVRKRTILPKRGKVVSH